MSAEHTTDLPVAAVGTEGTPTYGINWTDGTRGSGWTDLDVKVR